VIQEMNKMKAARILVLAVAMLAGCQSTPTNFFYLGPLSPPPGQAGGPDTGGRDIRLSVEEVGIPRYLDRPDIVSQTGETSLDVSGSNHWAEPLKDGVARVLQGDLVHLLADRPVMVLPARFTDADAELYVQVSRFEVTPGGEAVVEAQWRIVRTSDGADLVVQRSEHRQPVAGQGYPTITAALNEALHGLSRDIAAATKEQIDRRAISGPPGRSARR
jgi:uncharacterized lipoprotein YmbA